MKTIQNILADLSLAGRAVANAGSKLALVAGAALLCGTAGAQTIPSGTFQFSTANYTVSDNEGSSPAEVVMALHTLLGARMTVVRSGGANGRVQVPITTFSTTNQTVVTLVLTTNGTS
ncbi:MAG: hypothetical protein JF609_11705, partial [Verrucomicrobia bacterium]|nr:hypothetical protein [Verrucomicrobiota bacterium]